MEVAVEINILLSFLGNHSKTIRKVEGKTHRQYFLVKLRDKYNLQTVKYVKRPAKLPGMRQKSQKRK